MFKVTTSGANGAPSVARLELAAALSREATVGPMFRALLHAARHRGATPALLGPASGPLAGDTGDIGSARSAA